MSFELANPLFSQRKDSLDDVWTGFSRMFFEVGTPNAPPMYTFPYPAAKDDRANPAKACGGEGEAAREEEDTGCSAVSAVGKLPMVVQMGSTVSDDAEVVHSLQRERAAWDRGGHIYLSSYATAASASPHDLLFTPSRKMTEEAVGQYRVPPKHRWIRLIISVLARVRVFGTTAPPPSQDATGDDGEPTADVISFTFRRPRVPPQAAAAAATAVAEAPEAEGERGEGSGTDEDTFVLRLRCERTHICSFEPPSPLPNAAANGDAADPLSECDTAFVECHARITKSEQCVVKQLVEVISTLLRFLRGARVTALPTPTQGTCDGEEDSKRDQDQGRHTDHSCGPHRPASRIAYVTLPVYQICVVATDTSATRLARIYPFTNAVLAACTNNATAAVPDAAPAAAEAAASPTPATEGNAGRTGLRGGGTSQRRDPSDPLFPKTFRPLPLLSLSTIAVQLLAYLAGDYVPTAPAQPAANGKQRDPIEVLESLLATLTAALEPTPGRSEGGEEDGVGDASSSLADGPSAARSCPRDGGRGEEGCDEHGATCVCSSCFPPLPIVPAGPGALVHCQEGISRSASVVCLYVMFTLRQHLRCGLVRWRCPEDPRGYTMKPLQLQDMLSILWMVRDVVRPNPCFAAEMQSLWHKLLDKEQRRGK